MNLSAVVAVIRFEWQRMFVVSRMAVWSLLTCFPPSIVYLLVRQNGDSTGWEALVIYGLVPLTLCVLSLLLWVSSLVQSELEGRSWIYLAVRPGGRSAVLMGKYLAGVFRTVLSGWISMTLCIAVSQPAEAFRLWGVLFLLVALSSAAYGAIFALIAVIVPRRAMVVAGAYALVFEVAVSLMPAVISRLTVQFRLRSLLLILLNRRIPGLEDSISDAPAMDHLLVILGIVVGVLTVALLIINRREYVQADTET